MFEWTHDWQEDQSVHAVTDPLGVEGSSRVFRGGGWYGLAAYCRSADRDAYDPTYRSDDFGFRLALNPSGVTGPEEKRSKKP
jgi:formylglycine-generating enzyme required for sulfatase activity